MKPMLLAETVGLVLRENLNIFASCLSPCIANVYVKLLSRVG